MTNWEDASLVLPPEIVNKTFDEIGESFSGEFSEEGLREKAWDLAEIVDELSPDSTEFEIWEVIRMGVEFIRECGENPERILAAQEEQNRSRYWWFINHPEVVRMDSLGRAVVMHYAKNNIALSNHKAREYLENDIIHTDFPSLGSFIDAKGHWHNKLGYPFNRVEILSLLELERRELFGSMSDSEQDRLDWCFEVADIVHLCASMLIHPHEDVSDEGLLEEISMSTIEKLINIYIEGELRFDLFSEPPEIDFLLSEEVLLMECFANRGIEHLDPISEFELDFELGGSAEEKGQDYVSLRIERERVVLHNGIFVFERVYESSGNLLLISSTNVSNGVVYVREMSEAKVYMLSGIGGVMPQKALSYLGSIALEAFYTKVPAWITMNRVR